jgi:hypothetical protein
MKELIKLSQLPDKGGYTTFLYVSDKTNDCTVNELINLIQLNVKIVAYEDCLSVLNDIIDAKSAYEDALNKGLEDKLTEKCKNEIFTILGLDDWTEEVPHTAILLDDAINILKDNKYKQLKNLLFQNRQPKFTVFICAQDIFGVPVQLRRNCDTVWLFAGLTDKTMFGMMMAQLGLDSTYWSQYRSLEFRDVMFVNDSPTGTTVSFIKN